MEDRGKKRERCKGSDISAQRKEKLVKTIERDRQKDRRIERKGEETAKQTRYYVSNRVKLRWRNQGKLS